MSFRSCEAVSADGRAAPVGVEPFKFGEVFDGVRFAHQRLFRVGTIELSTADKTTPIVLLENIKNPDRTRDALSAIAEKERDEKRVLGKEMFGAMNDGSIAHDTFID